MIRAHATPEENADAGRRVAVRVPLPVGADYTYGVPEGWELPPGTVVKVPVGGRELWGAVWAGAEGDATPASKLKFIAEVAPTPPLSPALRKFVDWVAEYTLSAPGAVLRMVLSVPAALEPVTGPSGVVRADAWPAGVRRTPARQRLWAILESREPMSVAEAARLADVGDAAVRGLLGEGGLVSAALPPPEIFAAPDADAACPVLGPEQDAAAAVLKRGIGAGFAVTLLDGVTGSGKTEVYFEAVAEVLRQGGQALVLVPEIALTAQWLERFRARFGVAPAVWHSGLTPAQRRDTWRAVAQGEAKVLIGARSALFLPFAALGLIVVDEEHEQAFKQEDGVLYHGRDMAVVRGSIEAIPVVLASATPSLETLANARAGRYATVVLPRRHGGAEMPTVDLVDLRKTPPETGDRGRNWLAPPLVAAIGETLEKGEQVLLYLNRRGYAPLTLCRACGHRMQCPQCTAWLVEHRDGGRKRLQCHHCGHAERMPDVCPSCGAEDSFVACGPGVERIAEEVAARFPEARRLILASDQFSGPGGAAAALDSIAAREVDVIVGTQMVAKGHHFPGLTLVGVVDADVGLAGGDLRAAERTFQLLHQVAGRAGRGDLHGRVMMQTYDPAQPVIAALAKGDRDAFVAAEQTGRKALGLPPFGRLAAVIVAAKDDAQAAAIARDLARAFPKAEGLRLYGPAPAILSRLRGWSRHRLLVSAPRDVRLQPLLRSWLAGVAIPRAARVRIDIDPYSFL
jgi:primosomal protein N' (replication factor Y) (superfamily II helicase)